MSGTLLTPPGLLGSTQPAAQPGAGLGQLYNAVNGQMQGGGIWGNQGMTQAPAQVPIMTGVPGMQWYAPQGTQWNGPGQALQTAPPPAPLPTYNQWGQMQGGTPNLNTGPGLPQGNVAQTQQSGGGLAGLYDQWGRPTPQAVALAAAQSQQAPQPQGFDASGIDPKTMGALQYAAPGLAALSALSGVPNPYAGVPYGAGRGLLGNAVAGDGGGAGGDRGPSQGNQEQQDAATAAGGMAASGDKGPSAGGGTAASGHDQDEEGPF